MTPRSSFPFRVLLRSGLLPGLLPGLLLALAAAGCGSDGPPAARPFTSQVESRAPAVQPPAPFPAQWRYQDPAPPVTGRNGAVSTTDAYASAVALEVLQEGGNAADAAVAAAFALAVVNPEAGNIGGGGFIVLRTADGETAALDFREKAPLSATRDMFLDARGNLTELSVTGHLAAGVPGSVMGLWEVHRRYGTRPWESMVEPAVRLADGVVVTERIGGSLQAARRELDLYEATAATFLPGGAPPAVGDTFRQPELAATLRRIRDQGPDGFYRGETADLLVAEMERGGGIITHEDLEEYRAVWRDPVVTRYRGHTVISMPPSSSGGATLGAIAAILEGYDLGGLGWHSPEAIHLFAEAAKRAYADRNELMADPDFQPVPVARMIDPEYAAARREGISPTSATPSAAVHPEAEEVLEGVHTTHLSVVDAAGNAVSLTTTINSWYGSKVTVEGAGFLLNNEMDDFAARPGFPNQFGLVQGERNAIEPGKRMLSAMTPTLVLDPDGELMLVVGTPGGSTIITTVYQVISNILDHGMGLSRAVHAPRVHHQHLPDQIFYEPRGLLPATVNALEALGHRVVERGEISGDVQAIRVLPDGTLEAVPDPRLGGTAMAY